MSKEIKKIFSRYDSVLSEGFTDEDAIPPSSPALLKKFRTIGIYDLSKSIEKKVDNKKLLFNYRY